MTIVASEDRFISLDRFIKSITLTIGCMTALGVLLSTAAYTQGISRGMFVAGQQQPPPQPKIDNMVQVEVATTYVDEDQKIRTLVITKEERPQRCYLKTFRGLAGVFHVHRSELTGYTSPEDQTKPEAEVEVQLGAIPLD